jgi:hypothetical protein
MVYIYKDEGFFSRGKIEGTEVTTHLQLVLRLLMNAVIYLHSLASSYSAIFILKQGKKIVIFVVLEINVTILVTSLKHALSSLYMIENSPLLMVKHKTISVAKKVVTRN